MTGCNVLLVEGDLSFEPDNPHCSAIVLSHHLRSTYVKGQKTGCTFSSNVSTIIRHKRTQMRHLFNMCHSNSAGGLEHRAIREVIKNGCFTVRLTERRGGRGVSHLGPDRKQV